MGQRVQPVEADVGSALMALPELLGIAVQPPQRLVHVPEVPALLRREQELLFPLHRVGALIRHVKGVGREIAVRPLESVVERLVVVPQLLHHAGPLLLEPLAEVVELFLVQGHVGLVLASGWRRDRGVRPQSLRHDRR